MRSVGPAFRLRQAKLASLRDRCKNTLHLVCTILADRRYLAVGQIIHHCSRPVYDWFAETAKTLRSTEGSVQVHCELAGAKAWATVFKLTQVFEKLETLEDVGLSVDFSSKEVQSMREDSLILEREARLAGMVWEFVVRLVEQRSLGLMCHQTYPLVLAIFLEEDVGLHTELLAKMERDWQAWQAAKASPLPFWKRICKKSLMRIPIVQQIFALARAADFKQVTPGLKTLVSCMFQQFGTSAICEHGFKFLRDRERAHVSKGQASVSLWRTLTAKSVMSEYDSWAEVVSSTVPEPSAASVDFLTSIFKPAYRNTSADFKDLPGVSKPEWVTWSNESVHGEYAEFYCMTEAFRTGRMDQGPESWRSPWLATGMLVRQRGGDWHWVVTSFHCAVFLWPASSFRHGGATFFGWQPEGIPIWRVCDDFSKWEVQPLRVESPPGMFLSMKKKVPSPWPSTFCRSDGKPVGILKHGALNAFWKLGVAPLRRLISAEFKDVEGLSFSAAATLPEIVHGLVKHILKISDEDVASIMQQRALVHEEASADLEILGSDEVANNIEKSDLKEIESHVSAAEGAQRLSRQVQDHLKSLKPRPPQKKRRVAVGTLPDRVRPTAEQANELLPGPNFKWLRDEFNGRWQVWYRSPHAKCSASFSWGSRPEVLCVLLGTQWAWKLNESLGLAPCPYEDLEGRIKRLSCDHGVGAASGSGS